jgi:serine phosphatase RsbU (regulator of sigma subunit)/pSer/pThr/pTyr-binding forkhead associated (FHA) protein
MGILEVVNGTNAGATHTLEKPRTIVGRHPDCDIVVEAPAVSRQHAAISEINGIHYVEDLRSRNGTYVNDKLIPSRVRLNDLDQVRICDIVLQFHRDDNGSRNTAVFLDDTDNQAESSIMSKVDLSSSTRLSELSASTADKLDAIVELNKTLAKSLSLDEVLPQVLESLFTVFVQADRGFIVLRGKDGSIQPRWSKYRRADTSQARISRTILNRVMDSKEAILSADARDDQRFDMAESIMDFSIRSMMCAPLIDSEGQVLGALQLDTLDQRRRFRTEDLGVFVGITSQAAMAIVNAELHDVAMEKHAIQRELELAHEVQMQFLPDKHPRLDGFQFYDFYRPANQIGGDYYDYIELPDGRLAIIVADVSGHGIGSALVMAKLAADVRFCLATDNDPAWVLTRLNDLLCGRKSGDHFVTSILMILDPVRETIHIGNAGHNLPVLRRAAGKLELISEDISGLPLGMYGNQKYQQKFIPLGVGDILVLYTDGVTDAMNPLGDRYGDDRFRERIQACEGGIDEVGAALIEDVGKFTGEEPQNDDMCLVCVHHVSEQKQKQ